MVEFPFSSNLLKVDHDGATLTAWFKGGAIYEYDAVPMEEYRKLCEAKSPGTHIRERIINPQRETGRVVGDIRERVPLYPCKKVAGPPTKAEKAAKAEAAAPPLFAQGDPGPQE